jgi:hypothetical protein
VRVMVEGPDQRSVDTYANNLAAILRGLIGA